MAYRAEFAKLSSTTPEQIVIATLDAVHEPSHFVLLTTGSKVSLSSFKE